MEKLLKHIEIFRLVGNRFINDRKIQFSLPNSKNATLDDYKAFLKVCELSGELENFEKLVNEILENYKGDTSLWLNCFYDLREAVINSFKENKAYQTFNICDMQLMFPKIDGQMKPVAKNLYNKEAAGRVYVSIDLASANFTALNWVNPDITRNTSSFSEYLHKVFHSEPEFLLDYIADSKYLRQVIFGQLNPSRHITVERNIIKQLYLEYLEPVLKNMENFIQLEVANADEVVVSFSNTPTEDNLAEIREGIIKFCIDSGKTINLSNFHVETFTVQPHIVYNNETGAECFTFYLLRFLNGKLKYKGIPSTYYSITKTLLFGLPVEDWMETIYVDNMRFKLQDSITIKSINS